MSSCQKEKGVVREERERKESVPLRWMLPAIPAFMSLEPVSHSKHYSGYEKS